MFYGKNTPEEIEERELMGSMTGIYAGAEWLSDNICDTIYCRMRDAYASEGRDRKADLRNGIVPDPELIYVMAMLNNAYTPGEENFDLRIACTTKSCQWYMNGGVIYKWYCYYFSPK